MVGILVVISALLYVHQHIEIVRLNYILKSNETEVAQLLDQNGDLMYNIEKLENPSLLEERLHSNNVTLTMPEKWHIVKLAEVKKEEIRQAGFAEDKRSLFDFLIPKALAQGKPAE